MKKALSLLLAVLMLVSLFSGMAFADDDVIVEEPVAVDEIVGDDYAEAAEAVEEFAGEGDAEAAETIEEYDGEGDFEAAEIQTMETFLETLPFGWRIELMDPANPKCGDLVNVWVHDGNQLLAKPRTVLYDHLWELVSEDWSDASCTEGGTVVRTYKCTRQGCGATKTEAEEVLRQDHVWATDPLGGNDPYAWKVNYEDRRAVKVMPTMTETGVGHQICINCGQENPLTDDYVIPAHKGSDLHLYSEWKTTVAPTCSKQGYMERVCSIPGCDASENMPIAPLHHIDPATGESMIEFDHIERVTCWQYVEVWTCTNPTCCTSVDKNGNPVSTAPKASQFTVYHGVDDNVWFTWDDVEAAAEETRDAFLAVEEKEAEANEKYTEAVAIAQETYDTAVAEAQEAYDADVADAQNTYDNGVSAAQETYDDAIDTATEKYNEALDVAQDKYDNAIAIAAGELLDKKTQAAAEEATAKGNAAADKGQAIADAAQVLADEIQQAGGNEEAIAEAQAKYDAAVKTAEDDYNEECADAEKIAAEKVADAQVDYAKAEKEAQKNYDKAKAVAEVDFEDACEDAQDAYDETVEPLEEALAEAIETAEEDLAEAKEAAEDKFDEAVEAAEEKLEAAREELADEYAEVAANDPLFCYLVVYPYDRNTEHYVHHRFTGEYKEIRSPRCCVPGLMARWCDECGAMGEPYPTPALEPIYGTKVHTLGYGEYWFHFVTCTRPECEDEDLIPSFGKITHDVDDPKFFTQANNWNKQTKIVDHEWGEWKVELAPSDTNRGHWYRTCMIPGCGGREDFFGTQAEFDAMVNPPHPVLKSGLVWELEEGVPVCKYYEMGIFQEDFTGILDFEGGRFFVADGVMCSEASGLAEFEGTWYFLANGQIQDFYTGLALYDDEWFYLSDGVLDLGKNGLVDYDGSKFLLGAGRIQSEVNGLYQEGDAWYFIGGGQVATSYTGLVEYDGEWFYVEKGVLVPFNGEVTYDGAQFTVVNGMVVS